MISVRALEKLGRVRLSPNFFLRDFLYSEISQVEGIANIPVNPDLVIESGKQLCEQVLEPIQAELGKVSIRSAYRSPEINRLGNQNGYNCASNEKNYARHIWDVPDSDGHYGATACIVVNSFIDFYEDSGDWTRLAWWLHDHIAEYRDIVFYPNLAAFNINWYSGPVSQRTISAQMPNPHTGKKGLLTRTGFDNFGGDHSENYVDWLERIQGGLQANNE